MLRNIFTVGVWTLLSRFLGFVRDVLIAHWLGAGPVADAFFVALKLPNLFRRLFGEGAFSAAFVPAFSKVLSGQGRIAAESMASEVASVMVCWLLFLAFLGIIFMPDFLLILAPGFSRDPHKFSLAVYFARITFPYVALINIVALFSGVLNSLGRFAVAAAAPVFFNLCLITALLLPAHWFFMNNPAFLSLDSVQILAAGHALAFGVFAAGIIQLLLVAFGLKRIGFHIRFLFPRLTPEVRYVFRKMLPGLLGAGVTQINLAVDVIIASILPTGTVSVLYYADRINQLPLGVFGAALSTALLPTLAAQIHKGQTEEAGKSFTQALTVGMIVCFPAAFALWILAYPIIHTLFTGGAFSVIDAHRSAAALIAYAVGLPAFILIKPVAAYFFAEGDTKTPVKIGMWAVLINLLFNGALMFPLQQVGIALSTSLAAWFNLTALSVILIRRGKFWPEPAFIQKIIRILLSCVIMEGALAATRLFMPFTGRFFPLLLLLVIGISVYFGAGFALKAFSVADLKILLRKRRRRA